VGFLIQSFSERGSKKLEKWTKKWPLKIRSSRKKWKTIILRPLRRFKRTILYLKKGVKAGLKGEKPRKSGKPTKNLHLVKPGYWGKKPGFYN